jgi:hypothetical protein
VYSQQAVSVWGTGLSGGAPDSVRCARLPRAKWSLSGISRRRTDIIHRTVRCAPDCPVSQRSAAESARDTWSGQRSEGGTGLSGVHRTVRCARSATVGNGRLRLLRKGIGHRTVSGVHRTVRCAPDCPVRPTTEGKDGLPDLFSTAPSCLGAIKGTPRRMEDNI